jgi:hypothetical protein
MHVPLRVDDSRPSDGHKYPNGTLDDVYEYMEDRMSSSIC